MVPFTLLYTSGCMDAVLINLLGTQTLDNRLSTRIRKVLEELFRFSEDAQYLQDSLWTHAVVFILI